MPPWRIELNIQPKILLVAYQSMRQGIEHTFEHMPPQCVELNIQLKILPVSF